MTAGGMAETKSRSRMRPSVKHVIAALLLLALIAALHLSGVSGYLTLENLKRQQYVLEEAVHTHYLTSVLLYVLLYIVVTALAIPGGLVLTLAGGLLFHTFPGVVYVNVGATTGAVLAFLFSRHILGNWLQMRYRAQLDRFNRELSENGHLYLLALRLIPVFPFFLINILSGLTRISVTTFAWTTSLGIIPASLIYAFAGSQIGTIRSTGDLLSLRLLAAFALLALLALSPLVWKKLRAAKRA